MRKSLLTCGLLLAMLFPDLASAAGRCPNGRIIQTGATSAIVRATCGEPLDVEFVGEKKIGNQWINVERWTYVPDGGGISQILEFQGGILKTISNGPRL